jgi:hypothetical protein
MPPTTPIPPRSLSQPIEPTPLEPNAHGLPGWLLALAVVAGGMAAFPSALWLATLADPHAGPEGVLVLFVVPLPAFAIGAGATFVLLKHLQRISLRLAQWLAAALVIAVAGFWIFIAFLMFTASKQTNDRYSVQFEIFLPSKISVYRLGKRTVVGGQPQYYVEKMYSNEYSNTERGIFEVREFPKSPEFNPPTDCGSPIAMNSHKGHACRVIAQANGSDIYVSDDGSNSGMNYMLFTERQGTVIAMRTYGSSEENKAAMLQMMKSLEPAPQEKNYR